MQHAVTVMPTGAFTILNWAVLRYAAASARFTFTLLFIHHIQRTVMKKIFTLITIVLVLASCARSISIQQAAGGGNRGVRSVR